MSYNANRSLKTSFANSNRIAGIGIVEDSYSEESFPEPFHRWRCHKVYAFGHREELPPPEPVYTYNEKNEKILWELKGEN